MSSVVLVLGGKSQPSLIGRERGRDGPLVAGIRENQPASGAVTPHYIDAVRAARIAGVLVHEHDQAARRRIRRGHGLPRFAPGLHKAVEHESAAASGHSKDQRSRLSTDHNRETGASRANAITPLRPGKKRRSRAGTHECQTRERQHQRDPHARDKQPRDTSHLHVLLRHARPVSRPGLTGAGLAQVGRGGGMRLDRRAAAEGSCVSFFLDGFLALLGLEAGDHAVAVALAQGGEVVDGVVLRLAIDVGGPPAVRGWPRTAGRSCCRAVGLWPGALPSCRRFLGMLSVPRALRRSRWARSRCWRCSGQSSEPLGSTVPPQPRIMHTRLGISSE